ncbi:Uncharacterised protein [Lysinibacillus sphaericus]|nr:Uncharacterised protein [Lysinibacillus sphaericus]
MKDRVLSMLILFFVLGSVVVSSMSSLSHTLQSSFYIVAMVILIIIGILYIFEKVKSIRE